MEVLHLRQSSAMYGPENTILGFCTSLPHFGFQSTIGLIHRPLAGDPEVHPIQTIAAQKGIAFQAWDGFPTRMPALVRSVRELLQRKSIDVIHAHDYKANWIALLAARNLPRRPALVSTPRHSEQMWLLRALQYIDERFLPRFDLITEASTPAMERLAHNPKLAGKLRMVEHGVGDSERGLPQPLPELEGKPVVVMAGRLERVKGHQTFLHAMSLLAERIPELQILLAGDGSMRRELMELVASLGLNDRVHFLGFRSDIDNVFRAADVAVIASSFETSCRVGMEALEYGCPLVSTPVGIIPKLSDGGRAVRLTPVDNAISMAEAVEEVLRNPVLAATLRRHGQESIRRSNGHQAAAAVLSGVYREALELRG